MGGGDTMVGSRAMKEEDVAVKRDEKTEKERHMQRNGREKTKWESCKEEPEKIRRKRERMDKAKVHVRSQRFLSFLNCLIF